jgi:hypothetical protein
MLLASCLGLEIDAAGPPRLVPACHALPDRIE